MRISTCCKTDNYNYILRYDPNMSSGYHIAHQEAQNIVIEDE